MGFSSRRCKEITAMVLCVASAARGWYDLKRGASFGIEMATLLLVWALAYVWLGGRQLWSRPRRRETPLEAVMSWGMWAFFLAVVLWIATGAPG
jgi:hypothetical protein